MEDNNLYALFWVCAAAVVIAVTSAVTYYNVSENEILAKSPNPALLECAISSERQKTAFCVNLSQVH